MATYYLSNVDGSNSDDGSSWANAVATLEYAVETLAASGGPHTILVDSAHSELLSGDTAITALQDLRIISVNRSGSDAPLAGAAIGVQTTNYTLSVTGAFKLYVFGVLSQSGTSNSSRNLNWLPLDGGHFELEDCTFKTGSAAAPRIVVGNGGANANSYVRLIRPVFYFGSAGSAIALNGPGEMLSPTFHGSSSAPTVMFSQSNAQQGTNWTVTGGDLSIQGSNTLVGAAGGVGSMRIDFSNVAIGTGTVLAAATTVLNKGNTTVNLFNCGSGDNHYAFGHYDAFGSTVAQTTIYANDGAKYDGTNGVAWAITTTANCSFYTPYVSPWFSQYAEAGTVTPTVEIVRDGSATAYQDDEVWGEFSYQGTSGSTKATIESTRTAVWPLSPSNIPTGDLGAGDWTGENATAWFGKLSPGSITINEIGHLSARIVVGEPEITVYADPTIRV